MPATITGQKLSQLNNLVLGTTGCLMYIVNELDQNFNINISELFNTLSGLYLNQNYVLSVNDSRYVHSTGTENIYGSKSLYDLLYSYSGAVITNGLANFNSGYAFIGSQNGSNMTGIYWTSVTNNENSKVLDIGNQYLFNNANLIGISFGTGLLYDNIGAISADYNNRVLSGNWYSQALYISGSALATAGNIALTGQQNWNVANNNSINISGNLQTTGSVLNNRISGVSGELGNIINWSGLLYYGSVATPTGQNVRFRPGKGWQWYNFTTTLWHTKLCIGNPPMDAWDSGEF